jgi:extracellular factor (EF) 3-hydroxypalmitic acid methyl ester biosynthesis protein
VKVNEVMENPVHSLKKSVDSFLDIKMILHDRVCAYNEIITRAHDILIEILNCERAGIEQKIILDIVRPVREAQGKSPFVNRLQTWPRGYPGDFITIEYLVNGRNTAPEGTIEYYFEEYALTCAIAQQHRNKLFWQTRNIIEQTKKASQKYSILSFACGSCIDIHNALPHISDRAIDFVLIDHDSEAIVEIGKKFKSFNNITFKTILINPLQGIKAASEYGKYDLVFTGGLFDYLQDKQIVFMVKHIFNTLLNAGGKIFFPTLSKIILSGPGWAILPAGI